ncbi:arginine--tRNA ligase [Candidatus Woesearchaeota archaeon]|jgi:arginyl-tRNA synthetase|nr:arginine--tRNA ligase [Candidatus Woesearchaeota archaeon]MBT6518665.1 arginine--tRNA ligase [Candidatus Woesearchaeota archaeon]MBT7368855.1 arginine--tRNA ligase [Candidatus Woesearchaeota archaeon]
MNQFKEAIIKLLANNDVEIEEGIISTPPNPEMGDYAVPCFQMAAKLKNAPPKVAEELAQKIDLSGNEFISGVKNFGPYLNFFVNKSKFIESVLSKIIAEKENYGTGIEKSKILIESPGPNTNKPLHLGHLRNVFIGASAIQIFRKLGNDVSHIDIVNDRGIHICKSMLAYQKFGECKEPDIKSDHFVGKYYVLYSQKEKENPELEEEAREMLRKWEAGDPETIELWKKMKKWSLDGMNQTYERLNFVAEKVYYESEQYARGKKIVLEGVEKGLFTKNDEGCIIIDLTEEGFGEKVLLRADGTSVYVTQDISTAKARYEDYNMDKIIYVVATEQNYHFKVLFKVLEKIGFEFAKNLYHMAYGMVNLPDGKMKSREGTVVDADELLDQMQAMAKEEIVKRHTGLSEKEIDKRSNIISQGALRFFILKVDSHKDMTYDPKEAISFEGETGPYVQYVHARCCAILRKYNSEIGSDIDYGLLVEDSELEMVKLLSQFGIKIEEAAKNYKPSTVAQYLIQVAQQFNEFYHKCQVIGEDAELTKVRIRIVESVKLVIKMGLELLAIDAPEEM